MKTRHRRGQHRGLFLTLCLVCLVCLVSLEVEAEDWSASFSGGGGAFSTSLEPALPQLALNGVLSNAYPNSESVELYTSAATLEAADQRSYGLGFAYYRLGLERRIGNSGLALGLAISGGQADLQCRQNCAPLTQLLSAGLILAPETAPTLERPFSVASLLPLVGSEILPLSANYTLLDLGARYYFEAKSSWSPVLAMDIGMGRCSTVPGSNAKCSLARLSPGIGLRYSWSKNWNFDVLVDYRVHWIKLSALGLKLQIDALAGPGVSMGVGYDF